MGAAASLHCCNLLRILNVADVEDSHTTKTIFRRSRQTGSGPCRRRWKTLRTAVEAAVRHFNRHEHQVLVNRHIALPAWTDHRSQETGLCRIGDVKNIDTIKV